MGWGGVGWGGAEGDGGVSGPSCSCDGWLFTAVLESSVDSGRCT